MRVFRGKILQKVYLTKIPRKDINAFVDLVEYRYKSGRYTLPKSLVTKYLGLLSVFSLSLYSGASHYYLRDLLILPPEAIYDYYLIVKNSGCLRRDVRVV